MKNTLLLATLAGLFLLAACVPTTPAPTETPTPLPTDTATPLPTLLMPTLVPTLVPTSTPSPTATPDYSLIKYTSIYFNGTTGIVFVFTLNGVQGAFHGIGNNYSYQCKTLPDMPDKLYCTGAYQAPGSEIIFKLFEASSTDPMLTLDTIASGYPPTPVGMTCETEPLWVLPLTGTYGCYAVTCYLGGIYYDGTPNTCVNPWRWPVP